MPTVSNIQELTDLSKLKDGLFLCLIGTNKIPPHIAIIANGKYYSTSVKGVKIGIDNSFLLKIIIKKNTPTLFLKLKEKINPITLQNCYKNYPQLTPAESCLYPIKDYFKALGWETKHWGFVFNAVDDFIKKNRIVESYALNMEQLLHQQTFKLTEYTKEDIIALIKELKSLC